MQLFDSVNKNPYGQNGQFKVHIPQIRLITSKTYPY